MRKSLYGMAAIVVLAIPAPAQRIDNYGFELRPFVGAYVPFTAQRKEFKDATTVGGQAAWEMGDYFHLVGMFGWTHGHNKFSFAKDNTYVMHYDVGAEGNLMYDLSDAWMLRPFLGLGAGGRTYDYGAANVGSTTCAAGYGAIGTELQRKAIALRLEARDYLNCFESPITGKKKTRNDGLFTFGIAYHVR